MDALGAPPTASDRGNILDILSALEAGTKKEEEPLLTAVLAKLKTKRAWTKQATADRILKGPGFEAFLFAVLTEVKPFAAMVREIYAFLNSAEVTARRRASIFRVSSEAARAALDFSLENFPRELLAVLTATEWVRSLVELRFPGLQLVAGEPVDWIRPGSEAANAWEAVSPRWDGDFYDDGFHRALSYAHTVIPRENDEAWRRLRGLIDPILDRLAAVVECCNEVRPVATGTATWWQARERTTFSPLLRPAHAHRVVAEQALPYLRAALRTSSLDRPLTVRDALTSILHGAVIAIHLFENESLERQDSNNWLRLRLGHDPSPEEYIAFMERQSSSYLRKLDLVAPVVGGFPETMLQEKLVEFLLLPFWKNRWFLYELWTLVLVLATAARNWPLEIEGLEEREPGTVDWNLPGGMARRPVATIGEASAAVLCWAQRKTFHPGTGEGLEPDLRLACALPGHHDLLIIENKDRRKPPGPELRDIARRYVEGTCAESLWLVNYDVFPAGLLDLEGAWPGRGVHLVSNFKPGSVPELFQEEIARTLDHHLSRRGPVSQETAGPRAPDIEIALSWGATPRDLDLYVRVVRDRETQLISYRNRGDLTRPPFAELDRDVTTGNGTETVRVKPEGLDSLSIAVLNFSQETPLASSRATVVLTFAGGRVSFQAPDQGAGAWWIVAGYDPREGHLKAVNLLADSGAPHGFP